jgi:hypothetical protein
MTSLKKLTALLGAGALVFAMAGTALAATGASDQGITPTWHDGNIGIGAATPGKDSADCVAADGIETGNTAGSDTTDSGVTVTWTYDGTTKEFGFTATGGVVLIAYVKGGDAYNEYDYSGLGGVASDGGMFAPDNASGGPAGLSHAVFCTGEGGTTTTTTTTEVITTTTDVITTTTTTDTFSSETGGETDAPSEPNTATLGTSTGAPADGAWLLVIALGVLLASIVVMTPAKARR